MRENYSIHFTNLSPNKIISYQIFNYNFPKENRDLRLQILNSSTRITRLEEKLPLR